MWRWYNLMHWDLNHIVETTEYIQGSGSRQLRTMALNTSNGRGQITGRSFPWPFQRSRGRRNILHKTSDTKDKLSLTCPLRLENIISWIFHGCINVREHFLLTPNCSALMNIKRDIFLWVKGPFIYSLYCLKAIRDFIFQSRSLSTHLFETCISFVQANSHKILHVLTLML